MKIKAINIKNFRSIKEQTITCGNQAIFIGPNGAGKSTVLKALQAFFDLSFKQTPDDYFAHNVKNPIEITVVFSHFTEAEAKDFETRIHNGEMSVTRTFGGEAGEAGNYNGLIHGCEEFQTFRAAAKAGDKKEIYSKLIAAGYDLPTWKNQADAETALLEWEASNADKCGFIKDGGQFFGFKNVGAGKLQKAANFIMIEAVRDVSEEANDQKSSAIAQLMDLIVRSAMKQHEKITKYQEQVNKEYAVLTSPDNFPQLGSLQTALTISLGTYYQDVGVKLNWKETAGVALPPPQARIKFKEDDFEYPVERAGNGVQRAFIISLLHQLLVAKSNTLLPSANDNPEDEQDTLPAIQEIEAIEKLPSVILAIEEPELYQHPTKQWHFAQVLKRLSSGELEDTFGDVQVLFCTHSPNFVDLAEFHDTRIASKVLCEETNVKHTVIREASLTDVTKMNEAAWNKEAGTFTEEGTKALLHIFGTELSEGFFADGIILVEGVTDKTALETIASLKGKSFMENNIAVLSVNGKGNMDKPWMVFSQLGIPVFPLWDADSNCETKEKQKMADNNKALQRMLGIPEAKLAEFPGGVYENYACFSQDLNEQLKADFGTDYDAAYLEALSHFNLPAGKGKKNPFVIADTIRRLYSKGKKAETLEAVIEATLAHIFPNKRAKELKAAA